MPAAAGLRDYRRTSEQVNGAIAGALRYMTETGCTKEEAAKRYGLSVQVLRPSSLAARAKILQPISLRLSEIVVEHDGKPKSGREIFADAIKAALARMAELAPTTGKWSKDEERSARQCLYVIGQARAAGLLDAEDAAAAPLPAELRADHVDTQAHPQDDEWKPSGMLTVIADLEPQAPSDGQP